MRMDGGPRVDNEVYEWFDVRITNGFEWHEAGLWRQGCIASKIGSYFEGFRKYDHEVLEGIQEESTDTGST